jgi:hypothetical protein
MSEHKRHVKSMLLREAHERVGSAFVLQAQLLSRWVQCSGDGVTRARVQPLDTRALGARRRNRQNGTHCHFAIRRLYMQKKPKTKARRRSAPAGRVKDGTEADGAPQWTSPPEALEHTSSALPLVVAERMQRRMVVFAGVPFLLGLSAFGVFFFLKYRYDVVVIPPVVGYATLGLFGVSLFGLTYGIMSASWDAGRVGSLLGWDEAQRNLLNTIDAFWRARSRERLDDLDSTKDDAHTERPRREP